MTILELSWIAYVPQPYPRPFDFIPSLRSRPLPDNPAQRDSKDAGIAHPSLPLDQRSVKSVDGQKKKRKNPAAGAATASSSTTTAAKKPAGNGSGSNGTAKVGTSKIRSPNGAYCFALCCSLCPVLSCDRSGPDVQRLSRRKYVKSPSPQQRGVQQRGRECVCNS